MGALTRQAILTSATSRRQTMSPAAEEMTDSKQLNLKTVSTSTSTYTDRNINSASELIHLDTDKSTARAELN